MLIVLFSLLLLSVVGLGMMYSTNMETAINSNYRDKQGVFYAALAGLQEARDRLHTTTTGSITPPSALPVNGSANVIYIVADASTIKPWDPSNPYFDTELCQENVLGLSHTTGAPCTGSDYNSNGLNGASWRQIKDDSLSGSAPWNSTNLDWKWTRITMKGNNMTPWPVNGSTSSTAQVCWEGTHQMSTPYGTSTGCTPVGGVTSIIMVTTGTGYTSVPSVTLTSVDGKGSGATATASIAAETTGVVTTITPTTGGVYSTSTPPTVTLTGGGGSGATATATMSVLGTTVSGYVSTVSLTAGGSGYTSAPTVVFTGDGSGATATATIATSTTATAVALDTAGTKCYLNASEVNISISGGGGSGATATATLDTNPDCIYSWTFKDASAPSCGNTIQTSRGYTTSDQSSTTFAKGNASFAGMVYTDSQHKKLLSSGCCTVTNPGYDSTNYNANFDTTLVLTNGTHTDDCNNFTVSATVGRRVSSIAIASHGSGYTSTPTVTISGGSGLSATNPTGHATIGTMGVTSITLTNGGSGYTTAPSVSFSGGGGSGATATAQVITTSTSTYQVSSITVGGSPHGASGYGSGYTSAPTVSFTGANQLTPAAATATIATQNTGTNYVSSITVGGSPLGGSGYDANPTVTITPTDGNGSGATATAIISGGTKYGRVYVLTSYAQSTTGARAMVQMETAGPVLGFALGGALTLDGPNPTMDAMPNSTGFYVKGTDANSCSETAEPDHPAIDGYDDPNAAVATHSVDTIKASIPSDRTDHYVGTGGTPSVQNGYGGLGETMTSPSGLQSIITAMYNATPPANRYGNNPGSIAMGTCPSGNIKDTSCHPITDYVDGNLTLSGSPVGYGILVVTGTLTLTGDFTWNGLVLVIGDGVVNMSGGGNAQIKGSLLVSKIWDGYATKNLLSSLGSPSFSWNGGGGNGIQYDHCWATDLIDAVPFPDYGSSKLPKALSLRILPY